MAATLKKPYGDPFGDASAGGNMGGYGAMTNAPGGSLGFDPSGAMTSKSGGSLGYDPSGAMTSGKSGGLGYDGPAAQTNSAGGNLSDYAGPTGSAGGNMGGGNVATTQPVGGKIDGGSPGWNGAAATTNDQSTPQYMWNAGANAGKPVTLLGFDRDKLNDPNSGSAAGSKYNDEAKAFADSIGQDVGWTRGSDNSNAMNYLKSRGFTNAHMVGDDKVDFGNGKGPIDIFGSDGSLRFQNTTDNAQWMSQYGGGAHTNGATGGSPQLRSPGSTGGNMGAPPSIGGGHAAPAQVAPNTWEDAGGNMVRNTTTGQVVDKNHPIYLQSIAGTGGAPGGSSGGNMGDPTSMTPAGGGSPNPPQADLRTRLNDLIQSGGGFNQDIVNRRTESAKEGLMRQRSSQLGNDQAYLADRGLAGSGAEVTGLNKLNENIDNSYQGAVSDIYANESQNADKRMSDAISTSAGMTEADAQHAIDQYRAEVESRNADTNRLNADNNFTLGNRNADNASRGVDLGFLNSDRDYTLGQGHLAVDNMNGQDQYNLGLGNLGLGRDTLLSNNNNAGLDRLLEILRMQGGGAATTR